MLWGICFSFRELQLNPHYFVILHFTRYFLKIQAKRRSRRNPQQDSHRRRNRRNPQQDSHRRRNRLNTQQGSRRRRNHHSEVIHSTHTIIPTP